MTYQLFYWHGIAGRGEFVRLALEDAGATYTDQPPTDDLVKTAPSFAPPYLRDGDVVIGQTANILLYLGDRLGLSPKAETSKLWVNQIQLTIMDLVLETHDVHHPLGAWAYYEDQKQEAVARASGFRDLRIPKHLAWFESIFNSNPEGSDFLVSAKASYADLSLFHVVSGLKYAFPNLMKRVLVDYPLLRAHSVGIAERPNLKAYLASDRRPGFNENGIFRHYPELDET